MKLIVNCPLFNSQWHYLHDLAHQLSDNIIVLQTLIHRCHPVKLILAFKDFLSNTHAFKATGKVLS